MRAGHHSLTTLEGISVQHGAEKCARPVVPSASTRGCRPRSGGPVVRQLPTLAALEERGLEYPLGRGVRRAPPGVPTAASAPAPLAFDASPYKCYASGR